MNRADVHKALGKLIGHWQGEGILYPTQWGPGASTLGTWQFSVDQGGWNIIQRYDEERSTGSPFQGNGVLTSDPDTAEVVWFWFDNYGFPPFVPSKGGFAGDVLTLDRATARGHGRTIFTLSGDRLKHRILSKSLDASEYSIVSEGEFKRIS